MKNTQDMQDAQQYLQDDQSKDLLRFITCGSVDDGKSTLIGRLLYDSKMVLNDQLITVREETKKYGTVGKADIDFALLVDGLQSEREQGITIDVAYRFFATNKRKYIIADTPGHEQYTRNMATGASTADLAIILIDARKGVLTQTRRHSFLACLFGIQNIVVAINKMDLIDYDQQGFNQIVSDYNDMFVKLVQSLPYKKVEPTIGFIAMSALQGDNVVDQSTDMAWYQGKPLLEYLDNVTLKKQEFSEFRYSVQYVNRPHLDFRGFSGTVASGAICPGDKIIVYPSSKQSTVQAIVSPNNPETNRGGEESIAQAYAPMEVTLTLEDEIDIAHGDIIAKVTDAQPIVADNFEAMLIWLDEAPLTKGTYLMQSHTKETNASVSQIIYQRDVDSWQKIETTTLRCNDIARVQIELNEPLTFDMYEECHNTGAFILIDTLTNNTMAAGMIVSTSVSSQQQHSRYTEAEKKLNSYIRSCYPEWNCERC